MSGVIGTSGRKIATRKSYGNALAELSRENGEIVVLDTDLTMTTETGILKKAFPERHINRGIAECSMVGITARLAATDMVPLASSFAMLTTGRVFEQARNSTGCPRLNVKIGATRAGISVGEDGATHQCNEDIALMRTTPGVVVICPFDDAETKAAVRATTEYDEPVYPRFGRLAVSMINDGEDYSFAIGKGMIPRKGRDVTVVATGPPVSSALEAATLLEKDGTDAEVINVHTIRPLDEELITASTGKIGKVAIVEEYSAIEGLGSAVCDALYGSCLIPVKKIDMQNQFGGSGPAMELIHKYRLNSEDTCAQVEGYLGR